MNKQRGYGGFVFIAALMAVIVLLIVAVSMEEAKERKKWEAFRVEHSCKIVGRMQGHTSTGIAAGSNGGTAVVSTSEPGKIGWLCDDGVTYWRNN